MKRQKARKPHPLRAPKPEPIPPRRFVQANVSVVFQNLTADGKSAGVSQASAKIEEVHLDMPLRDIVEGVLKGKTELPSPKR